MKSDADDPVRDEIVAAMVDWRLKAKNKTASSEESDRMWSVINDATPEEVLDALARIGSNRIRPH